jgi:hypothetical protein
VILDENRQVRLNAYGGVVPVAYGDLVTIKNNLTGNFWSVGYQCAYSSGNHRATIFKIAPSGSAGPLRAPMSAFLFGETSERGNPNEFLLVSTEGTSIAVKDHHLKGVSLEHPSRFTAFLASIPPLPPAPVRAVPPAPLQPLTSLNPVYVPVIPNIPLTPYGVNSYLALEPEVPYMPLLIKETVIPGRDRRVMQTVHQKPLIQSFDYNRGVTEPEKRLSVPSWTLYLGITLWVSGAVFVLVLPKKYISAKLFSLMTSIAGITLIFLNQ